uniref:Uncharacterized protein n=1 Tax=Globodera rostochiensis TaxID=31243 RepID=A0A914I7I3_GLORO
MTFGGSDIPAGSTMSLGPLFPSSAPATSSPLTAPPSSRPSVLRQFRSLTSLNSAGSTTEALTALERGCAKLVRIEGDSANSAKNRGRTIWKNSSCREPLLERSRSLNTQKPIHWSTFNRTTLAFQLLFTPFGYPGIRLFGLRNFSVSMYTAPAFMACAMNCVNAVCIRTMFAENYVGVHAEQQQKSDASTADNDDNSASKLPPYDRRAALLCYGTRFTQMFVNTNLETLGAPLAMMMFAWTRADAVKYISIAQVAMSLLAFLTYVVFIVFRVDKVLSDRTNLVMSLVVLITFHVLTYSYPFLPGHVQTFRHRDLRNHSIPEPVGCDIDKFTWCDTVRPIHPVYFYICYVFCIGLAFPNINVSLNTLFSKVIGPRRQGTQQGVLQMSGGFARMLGPVLISSLYTSYGPQSAWMVELTVVSATLALWMMLFGRMVPLRLPSESVVQHPQQQHQQFEGPKAVVPSSTMFETRAISDQPLATTSSAVTTSRRRIRSLRSREERMPLVEPIDEGDEARTDMEDGAVVLNRNDTTVSTMASLR